MKMKRMEMRDITVGEYQFKVRPFGAKDATYIFGDVASIILPILGTVSVASDDKDAVNMEMFDGMDMDKEQFYRTMYRMKKITAAGVWEKVDEGELTKAQALRICGPRPKES